MSALEELLSKTDPVFKKQIEAKMLLSLWIYEGIKKKGLNKKEFAELIGVNERLIRKWLRGDHNFNIDTIVKIEHALNIKLINI